MGIANNNGNKAIIQGCTDMKCADCQKDVVAIVASFFQRSILDALKGVISRPILY